MSDLTKYGFEPLTPEQEAREKANAVIREAVGGFKNKVQAEIRALRRARRTEHQPCNQASIDQQIAAKEKEFQDVDCVYQAAGSPMRDHYREIVHWNDIMRKHGVAGY